jgi:hypothetical protein
LTWLLRAVETQAGLEEGLAIILTDRIGSLVRLSIESLGFGIRLATIRA